MSNVYAYSLIAQFCRNHHVTREQYAELLACCFQRLSQPDAPSAFACALFTGSSVAFDLYTPGDPDDLHRAAMVVLHPEQFAPDQRTAFLCFVHAEVAFPAILRGEEMLRWLFTFYDRDKLTREIAHTKHELRYIHVCPTPELQQNLTRHLEMRRLGLELSLALLDEALTSFRASYGESS